MLQVYQRDWQQMECNSSTISSPLLRWPQSHTSPFPVFTQASSVHTSITPAVKKRKPRCGKITPPTTTSPHTPQLSLSNTHTYMEHQQPILRLELWMDDRTWVDNSEEGDTKEGSRWAAAHIHTMLWAVTHKYRHMRGKKEKKTQHIGPMTELWGAPGPAETAAASDSFVSWPNKDDLF